MMSDPKNLSLSISSFSLHSPFITLLTNKGIGESRHVPLLSMHDGGDEDINHVGTNTTLLRGEEVVTNVPRTGTTLWPTF